MVGIVGDCIVEFVVCWVIVLIVIGVFLWWLCKKDKIKGVLIFCFLKGKNVFV